MTSKTALVFVHGAGGPTPEGEWLGPINAALSHIGYPRIDPSHDEVITCEYATRLSFSSRMQPPVFTDMPDRDRERHDVAFAVRQAELHTLVRNLADPASFAPAATAQQSWAVRAGFARAQRDLELLRIYHNEADKRASARTWIMSSLDTAKPLIVIAHSLGTVLVADVLRRLPSNTRIELLITLGSPLAAVEIGSARHGLADRFPTDRVLRWLNVYNAQDVVTGFRGLSSKFPNAVDVQVALGAGRGAHDLLGYLRSRPVAAAIGSVVFGGAVAQDSSSSPKNVARRIHPWWTATLIQTAFAARVSEALPTREWKRKLRIEGALKICAADYLRMINETRAGQIPILDYSPVADGCFPTTSDLLGEGWRVVKHDLSDVHLLPFVVGLLSQPIVPAFAIELKDEAVRDAALERLLNRIRKPGSPLADGDYVRHVRESLSWARKAIAPDFPLGAVLIGAGLVVLAATGIGLVVAAPAGLAGAAAITSTLAAFGPGGMTGGIATLAALTGTGAGAAGVGGGLMAEKSGVDPSHADVAALAHGVEALSANELKAAVISLLATVKAADAIGHTPDQTAFAVVSAVHDALNARNDLLLKVSPGSGMHKECQAKIEIIERAEAELLQFLRTSRVAPTPQVLAITA